MQKLVIMQKTWYCWLEALSWLHVILEKPKILELNKEFLRVQYLSRIIWLVSNEIAIVYIFWNAFIFIVYHLQMKRNSIIIIIIIVIAVVFQLYRLISS